MTENNGFSFGIGLCLGILIGGLFIYTILKAPSQQLTTQTSQLTQPTLLERLYNQKLEKRLIDEIDKT